MSTCNSDVVWRVEDLEGSDSGGKIAVEKNRDGPKDVFWTFERKAERLGENEYGDDITTCHIELTSEPKLLKEEPRAGAAKATSPSMRPFTRGRVITDLSIA